MANAMISDDQTCSFDDLNDIEFLDIDSSFVLSLLEDSHVVEDGDDDRLRRVIESLEAEISDQDSFSENNSEDCQIYCDVEHVERCSSTSTDDQYRMYFEGLDEEMMHYDISDFADEIENVFEYVGVYDYAEICSYGMVMEEDHDYHGCLWQ